MGSLYDTDVRAMQDSVRSVRSGSDGASGHVAPREYSRQAASREGSSRLAYTSGAGPPGPPGPPSSAAAHSLQRRSMSSVRHDSPALDALPEQGASEAGATGGSAGAGEYTSHPTGAATGSFRKSGSLSRVLGPFTSKGNMRSPAGTPRSTSDRAIAAASALPAPLASPSTKSMSRANTGGGGGRALQALGLGRLHGGVGASASYNDLRVGARTSSITQSATGGTGQGQGQQQGQQQVHGQVSRAGSGKGGGLHGTASSRRSRMFNAEYGPAGAVAGGVGGASGSIAAVTAAALSGGISSMPLGVAGGGGGGATSSNGYRHASGSAALPAAAFLESPAAASSAGASGAMAAALSQYVMPSSGGGGPGGPGGGRRTIFFSKNDVTVTGLPPSCLTSGRLPRCRDSTSGVLVQVSGGAAGAAAAGSGGGAGCNGSFGPQSSRLGRNSTDLMNLVARTASAVVPPSSQSAILAANGSNDFHNHHNHHQLMVDRSVMSIDLGRPSRNGLALAAVHRNGGLQQHANSAAMLSALTGGGLAAHGFGTGQTGRAPVVPSGAIGEASPSSLGARCGVSQASAAGAGAGAGARAGGELGARTLSAQLEHGSPRARLAQQGQPPEAHALQAQPQQLSAPLPLAQLEPPQSPQPLAQRQPSTQALPEPTHAADATAAACAAATAAATAAASADSSEAGARCDWVGSSLYAPSRCSDSSRLTQFRQPGGNGAGVGLTTMGLGTTDNNPSSCALTTVKASAPGVGIATGVGGASGGAGSYVRQCTSHAAAAGKGAPGDTSTGTGGHGSRALSQHTAGGANARMMPRAAAGAAEGELSTMLSSVMMGDESDTANNSSLLAPLPPGADLAAVAAAATLNNPLYARISASGRSGTGVGYTGHSNALFFALPDGTVSSANALNAGASAAAGAGASAPPPALPVVVQLPANSAMALATDARDVTSALNRLQEACLLAQKVDVSQRLTKRISLSIEHNCGPPGARPSAAGWGSSAYNAYYGGGGGGVSSSLGPGLLGYSLQNNIVAGSGAGGLAREGRVSYTRTTSASAALMAVRTGRAPPRPSLSRSHLAGGGAAAAAARAVGGMPGAASAIVGYLEDINSEPWVDPDHPDPLDNSDQPSHMQLHGGGDEEDGDGDGAGIVMDGSALFMAHDGDGMAQASLGSAAGMGFTAAMLPAMLYAGSSMIHTAGSAASAGGFGFGNGGASQAYSAVLMAPPSGDGAFGRRSSNIGGGLVEYPVGARTMAAVAGTGAHGSNGSAGAGVVAGGFSSQSRQLQERLRDDPSEDPHTQAMLNVLLQGAYGTQQFAATSLAGRVYGGIPLLMRQLIQLGYCTAPLLQTPLCPARVNRFPALLLA